MNCIVLSNLNIKTKMKAQQTKKILMVSIFEPLSKLLPQTEVYRKLTGKNKTTLNTFIQINKDDMKMSIYSFFDDIKDKSSSFLHKEYTVQTILLIILCVGETLNRLTDHSKDDVLSIKKIRREFLLNYCRNNLSREELVGVIEQITP